VNGGKAMARAIPLGRRARAAAAICLGGLSLAACSTFEKQGPAQPCPRFATVAYAGNMTRFVGTGHDLTDVDFSAAIGRITGECSYATAGRVTMTLHIPFIVERGPANQDGQARFDYFVAVATTANEVPAGGRVAFSVVIPFHGSETRNGGTEEVEQLIPLHPDENGSNYIVYAGFALTEDEFKYNQQTPAAPLVPKP
jgi:hypothetical protein